MAIIAYPLNGIQYSAEDAQTYLSTRTSGVYSAESHFSLGEVTADRRITIGAGLAWMKISEFGGISFAVTEPVTISVEGADENTPRTDLIVLRYDGNSQTRSVVCKKNSNSVQQSDGIFELALYRIQIPAGSTQIIASQIEDVRATELCGVMKDGVTGIPVNNLVEEFRAKVQNSIDTLNADAQEALSDFETDALNAINSFTDTGNQRISEFGTNSIIAITQFEQNSLRVLSDANEVIADLQQTENEFDEAVDAANGVVTNFTAVVIPDALAQFETEKQEHFSDFVDEGDATILDFKERGDRALGIFDETIADVASGADAMLQTAFNQSGKVGQVAFSDELGLVVNCGLARKLYTGQENVFLTPFKTAQTKALLTDAIKNKRSITLRLFVVRHEAETVSIDEWLNATSFIDSGEGTLASVFDLSDKVFDFRFQFADSSVPSNGRAYFSCLFEDGKTALLSNSLSIGTGGNSGVLTFS